ncbi:MAG: FMN-binding protein, partial [Bacteroidales bacterium]
MEKTIRYIVNLLLVSLFMLTIAVNRNDKIWGTDVTKWVNPDKTQAGAVYLPKDSAGIMIINSTDIAKDISGFGGPVPLKMYISDEKVIRIELLSNAETPEFLKEVINTGLLSKWDGVRLTDIGSQKVDAVSGATMTSSAIISTVKRVADIAQDRLVKDEIIPHLSLKSVIAILVILLGVILAFLKSKSKVARTILLILNVCVLGFWCGSFLSLSLLINWFSNGINLTVALVPFLLLLSAVILPLFGKKNNYCNYHCPMGSLQELASK